MPIERRRNARGAVLRIIERDQVEGIDQTKFRVLFRSLGKRGDIVESHNVVGDEALLATVKDGLTAGFHVTVRYSEVV